MRDYIAYAILNYKVKITRYKRRGFSMSENETK